MPAASSRSSTSMPCCACRPIIRRRTSGSATCSDRRRGEMRCSTMRCSSSGFRLVKVTNVPARKLKRKSSSRSVSDERMSSGSWRMKQKVQALRHCLTPSNTTPSNSKPQSSPSLALELHDPLVAVEVDVAELHDVVGREPSPVDEVAHQANRPRWSQSNPARSPRRRQGCPAPPRARAPAARWTRRSAPRVRCPWRDRCS